MHINRVTFTYTPHIRDMERQAVSDLTLSIMRGSPAPAFAAAVRAAQAAYMREVPDTMEHRKARMLTWAGVRCLPLPILAQAIPLLRTYDAQAENEGERSLAKKAMALVNEILDLPTTTPARH